MLQARGCWGRHSHLSVPFRCQRWGCEKQSVETKTLTCRDAPVTPSRPATCPVTHSVVGGARLGLSVPFVLSLCPRELVAPAQAHHLHSRASFGGWVGVRAEWPAGPCPVGVSHEATRQDWAPQRQGELSQVPAAGPRCPPPPPPQPELS